MNVARFADGVVGAGEAVVVEGNPLDPTWAPPASIAASRAIVRSGTLADESFARHPANWIGPGAAALATAAERLAAWAADLGVTVCFRPHCRHVLSDAPSCRAFLATWERAPFALALAPGDLFEPDMLATADEHLERIVGGLAASSAVILVEDAGATDDDGCVAAPPGAGALPGAHLGRLLREHLVAGTIVAAADPDAAAAWLGCPSPADAVK